MALSSSVHGIKNTHDQPAVVLAAEKAPARSSYNVVDDYPVTYKELFDHMAILVGGPPPIVGGPAFLPPFACRNDRLKGFCVSQLPFRTGIRKDGPVLSLASELSR